MNPTPITPKLESLLVSAKKPQNTNEGLRLQKKPFLIEEIYCLRPAIKKDQPNNESVFKGTMVKLLAFYIINFLRVLSLF